MAFEKRTFQKELIPPGERISNIEQYLNEIDNTFDPRLFEKRARLIDRLNNIEMYLAEKSSDYSARIWEKTSRVLDRLNYIEMFLEEYNPGGAHHVPDDNSFGVSPFDFYKQSYFSDGRRYIYNNPDAKYITVAGYVSGTRYYSRYLAASDVNLGGNSFYYDGKTVYYYTGSLDGYVSGVDIDAFDPPLGNSASYGEIQNPNKVGRMAWLMIYGGY